MKNKIALVAGCSHAAGSEIDGSQDSDFNRENSFGSLLAKKLDRTPVNIALTGGTNSSIARSILNWFDKQYDPDTMDVYVIVAWTDACRLEIPSGDNTYHYNSGNPSTDWFDGTANNYMRVLFGWDGANQKEREVCKFFHEVMAKHENLMEVWALNYILQIQYLLKSLNVDYIMTSAMPTFTYNDIFTQQYLSLVDQSKYHDIDVQGEQTFYWKYKNLGYENDKAIYWHHGIEPHQLYAEELYNFVKEKQNV